jgi:tetratricopeptide (TPR) repeat protein
MRFFHFVQRLILSSCILAISTVGYAHAEGPQDSEVPSTPIERLQDTSTSPKTADELLTQLKRERNPDIAKAIAATIVTQWSDSGSATVNLLVQWADKAKKEKRNGAALDFLDQVIVLDPEDANGWARRAALHYTMGNIRKAVSDLNEVLKIEPRYFPALQMLATILTDTGSDEKAMKAWQDYLNIYPADRNAQKAVSDTAEKLAGARI